MLHFIVEKIEVKNFPLSFCLLSRQSEGSLNQFLDFALGYLIYLFIYSRVFADNGGEGVCLLLIGTELSITKQQKHVFSLYLSLSLSNSIFLL